MIKNGNARFRVIVLARNFVKEKGTYPYDDSDLGDRIVRRLCRSRTLYGLICHEFKQKGLDLRDKTQRERERERERELFAEREKKMEKTGFWFSWKLSTRSTERGDRDRE